VNEVRRFNFISLAGGRCQQCGFVPPGHSPLTWAYLAEIGRWDPRGAYPGLHVHHRHYRTLGEESVFDVEVLCFVCHAERHLAKARFPLPRTIHSFTIDFAVRWRQAWRLTGSGPPPRNTGLRRGRDKRKGPVCGPRRNAPRASLRTKPGGVKR